MERGLPSTGDTRRLVAEQLGGSVSAVNQTASFVGVDFVERGTI